ncbi:hypothetical protein PHMEG_0007451 [Phytophthora megakarya]|uniref:Uncharacterized protein n=1 Tax=Phytophthora megakarya TaxID=4795 RepID=A0A225WNF9_9STRA|nr:hypothetical protein PHMEG_0007451 [Phytophthora megakarya]
MSEKFVLSEDGIMFYEGANRRKDGQQTNNMTLRLVVPTTIIQEVLQNCHDSLEGGQHRADLRQN